MTFPIIPARTASSASYTISRSLRFRNAASTYLTRTPASAGNRKTWTWSGWVKRGYLSGTPVAPALYQFLFGCFSAGNDTSYGGFGFKSNDAFFMTGWSTEFRLSTPVFRDASAWMHVVVVMNTPDATATNRFRVYINGTEITAWATNVALTQNGDYAINQAAIHRLGHDGASAGYYYDGYMADVNFIDGQALTPSSFGSLDTNGVWQPKAYTGTYGTNGFYLKFSDNTSTTTLCTDYSGNSNSFTPTSISLSGTTYDSMIDSPTNYDDTTVYGRGNYCVGNPLDKHASMTLVDGNLKYGASATAWKQTRTTLSVPETGKWYFEVTPTALASTAYVMLGFSTQTSSLATFPGGDAVGEGWQGNADRYSNGVYYAGQGFSYAANNVIMFAIDRPNQKIWIGVNGAWAYSGNPAAGTGAATNTNVPISGNYFPAIGLFTSSETAVANFGQQPFTYTPPSGFKALNTQNLPTPTIAAGNKYFDATTYTGNGGTLAVTNSGGFQPDFVWGKSRSVAQHNILVDAIRGANNYLISNLTNTEATSAAVVASFNAGGFTLGSDATLNTNASTGIGWQWNAGGSTVSNTTGSITSQVRANPTAGFSVVTWTHNGSSGTIGHGLGVAPTVIIAKTRNGANDWFVYSSALGNTKALYLDLNAAAGTTAAIWNNTSPTSSVFTAGTTFSTNTCVAYCFASVSGYSSFGTYTGNGAADGPFVYCGFRPRFLIIKKDGAAANWRIHDSSRSPYNLVNTSLYPNLTNAEYTPDSINEDFLSNGFKLRSADGESNASGAVYFYMAFAENPFQLARAR